MSMSVSIVYCFMVSSGNLRQISQFSSNLLLLSQTTPIVTHFLSFNNNIKNPQDLLNASIFFDFRALAGNETLLQPLREYVTKHAQATPRFIKLLVENSLQWKVPLNWFGSLETKELEGKNVIDIKLQGTAIVVDCARIYSLANGISAVNTHERLAAIGRVLQVTEAESQAWIAAFEYLQTLRLAAQIDGHLIGSNPNAVDVDQLNSVDRTILRESLSKVRNLQQHLELDYVR